MHETDRNPGIAEEMWLNATRSVLTESLGTLFTVEQVAETTTDRELSVWTCFSIRGEWNGEVALGIPRASRELSSAAAEHFADTTEGVWDALSVRISSQWQAAVAEKGAVCSVDRVNLAGAPPASLFRDHGLLAILKSETMSLPIQIMCNLQPATRSGSREQAPAHEAGNLDLLLDIELQAALRFGCREMPLREVLDLGTGDVVVLDRAVNAPVDLVVGDRIVARGDVVLVAGNYGLRITEVAEPQKRLETIRCLF